MTTLPELRVQCWRPVLLALTLLIAACGPGGGGTGTGPQALYAAGGAISGMPVPVNPDTPPGAGCAASTLRLDPELVELRAACGTFTWTGPWPSGETGQVVLQGKLVVASGASVPARLVFQLVVVGDQRGANVTVIDPAGMTLVAPAFLPALQGSAFN